MTVLFEKYMDGGWVLAIRPRVSGEELYLGHTQRSFKQIRNPWRYWCADPFLVHYNGVEYIFCEAFDIFKDRGVLAYRTIDKKGRVSKLRPCLDTGSHLSYPNVFCHKGQMYMIPESGTAEEIAIFKASHFPDTWKKQAVLLDGVSACDTNLVEYQGEHYLLTLVFDKSRTPFVYDKLYEYIWNTDRFVPCTSQPVVQDARYARNAGNMFNCNGVTYRVSQDCKNMYGESITFHQVVKMGKDGYEERAVQQIGVADIKVDSRTSFEGLHTYNADEQYEIVDLQRKKWFRIERLIYLLINKLRQLWRIPD